MARIASIRTANVRLYTDSGQVQANVEWCDEKGKTGRTSGPPSSTHMKALLKRAKREGIKVEAQRW
jgi:hypothetical protein